MQMFCATHERLQFFTAVQYQCIVDQTVHFTGNSRLATSPISKFCQKW